VRGISFIFIGIDAAGDVFSFVSVCMSLSPLPSFVAYNKTVFQPTLDILGLVIYATEFVLWCGVFACGGYYNFMPWVKIQLHRRGREERELSNHEETGTGVSNAVELERISSSRSVFRTPSSVAEVSIGS
jgi:hypothetical protein